MKELTTRRNKNINPIETAMIFEINKFNHSIRAVKQDNEVFCRHGTAFAMIA
jgi:hypothetical protein